MLLRQQIFEQLPMIAATVYSLCNLLHRSLEEELRECKRDLEAKEREIESLMGR